MLAGEVEIRILATLSPPPNSTAVALRHLAAVTAAGLSVTTNLDELNRDAPQYILGLEGAEPFGTDLELIETFYWAGVRVVGLTWMHANAITGACGQQDGEGISKFGRDFLREMQHYGIILDLAHISDQGFLDAIDIYDGPIMCSHTCSRRLRDHSRNITDEQLRLLKDRNGIVGVCFFGDFLDDNPAHRTAERVVDHLETFMEIIGEDNVGIGPDWCDYLLDVIAANLGPNWTSLTRHTATQPEVRGVGAVELTSTAEGLEDPSRLHVLAEALNRRSLPSEKILYDNAYSFLARSLGGHTTQVSAALAEDSGDGRG
jgi:microsomal dipeptidase-like Zn-dependent dipeptidase